MGQPNTMLPGMASAPMASGIAPSYQYGMEGMPIPFGSDPRMAIAGQFILAPRVKEMMAQGGFAPMGLGHDQNVFDTMKKQQYTQMQAAAIQAAAQHDRENMFRTFRGMSAMAGVGFGAEQRRAAGAMTDMVTMASPMLAAMNPDLLDQLGGSRGSAAVMAKRVLEASRYRLDPVSGRMGTSAASMNALSGQLFNDLYLHGDRQQMGALTAGQAGALFGELGNRGMLMGDSRPAHMRGYAAVTEMQRMDPATLAAAAKRQGVTVPGEMSKISGSDLDKLMLDDSVATKLRAFDAEKIKRSLKSYAGAVTAMRDIFGDMGHPNAPMSELLGGLEALTMGSLSQMDPARAGTIARQTYNLAKQTGVTMDSAMVLQQHAGARAQQLGLDPIFAVHATQGALAFGGAYRAQGHAAHAAFGAFNADQMTQLDANLRLQAAGSNMANQLGAAMRLKETAGFKNGSTAQRYTTAIASGVNEFVDAGGKVRSLNMNQGEFMAMMRDAGVDEGTVRDLLDQRETNREQIDRYGITNIVRKEQATGEMRPQVALRMGETLNQRLRSTGKLSDDSIRSVIDKVSPAAAKRIMEMSTEKFARTGDRETEISRILAEEMQGTEAGGLLASMGKDERNQFLQVTASQFYGNMDRFVKTSGYRGMGSFQNVHRSMNKDVMREAERQQLQARMTGELQESLSPLGRGSALSRAIDAMQDVREGDTDSMQKVMIKAFGGVDSKEVNLALQKPLMELATKKTQIEQLTAQVSRAPDGEEKIKLMGELDTLMREVKAQTAEVAKTGEKFGIYKDGGLTVQDTQRALQSTSNVARGVLDLAGVRGAFGRNVSDDERAAAAANYGRGKMTNEEAAVVIMAHRQADLSVSDEEAKKLSEASGGKYSVDQARASILARKRDGLAKISDADMGWELMNGGIDLSTDRGKAAATALALHRRSRMPLRGSTEDVQKLMAANPGMTELQAQDQADAEARSKRLGIPHNEIAAREAQRFVVTDEQRKEFHKAAGLEGKVDIGTDEGKKVTDEMILKRRAAEEKQLFMGFRQSDDGARFREDVDMRSQDVENVMSKLITSPQMMKRFGMWSIKMHDDLKAGQQRLREMAMLHAGGDMSRLIMDDTDIDKGTVEGAAKAARVRQEVQAVIAQQTHNIRAAHETHGKGGGNFQLGTIGEALIRSNDPALGPVRDLARRHALISMGLDDKMSFEDVKKTQSAEKHQEFLDKFMVEANKIETKNLHESHQSALLGAREKIGNAQEALGLLGVRIMPGESAEEALERIKKTATDPNASDSLKKGHAYAVANFDRVSKAVAATRRMKPEDQELIDKHTGLMDSVEAMAKARGVTVQELTDAMSGKGGRTIRDLTAFSHAEEMSVGKARSAIEEAQRELDDAEADDEGAEFGLGRKSISAADRKALTDRRANNAVRIANAKKARDAAYASVDTIAIERGVSSKDLLFSDKGRLTKEQIEAVQTDLRELGKITPETHAMLKSRGVTLDELRDVNNIVTKAGEDRQREALDREQKPGEALLEEFQEAFGYDKKTAEKHKDIAGKLGGIEQRRLMHSVIGTQASLKSQASDAMGVLEDRLKKYAPGSPEHEAAKATLNQMRDPNKKNAGVDVMVKGYKEAMASASPAERRTALEKFATTYGMNQGAMSRFEQAYELQAKYGTLDYGDGRRDGEGSLGKIIDRIQQGGVDFKSGVAGPGGTSHTHVTGVLEIRGTVGHLDAATGGAAVHGGPGS